MAQRLDERHEVDRERESEVDGLCQCCGEMGWLGGASETREVEYSDPNPEVLLSQYRIGMWQPRRASETHDEQLPDCDPDSDPEVLLGQDNASYLREDKAGKMLKEILRKLETFRDDRDGETPESQENSFPVRIPNYTSGTVTFAHQQALANRIREDRLNKHADLDMRAYTPTFIHDCLMLPGSLASLLGKDAPADVVDRMTPALLPGFGVLSRSDDQAPCLIQATNPEHYALGMLLLGEGSNGRDLIHEHYRPYARRVKVQVEVDFLVKVRVLEGMRLAEERWRSCRRQIWAHAWLWSDVRNLSPDSLRWSIEDYISGALGGNQRLRIEESAKGDEAEDGDVEGACGDAVGWRARRRETVYGGPGPIDYVRTEHFAGW